MLNVSSKDRLRELEKIVRRLSELDVLVGVPEGTTKRKKDKINNAQLVYIHTHGSPVNNIPPRPLIEPAIEDPDNKKFINEDLKDAARNALEGDEQKTMSALVKAGIDAQNAVRDWFTNPKNNWPPNSPLTIAKKGSNQPLIDTGALRQSIIYVIRKKGEAT